jgi:hypothetical protein
MNLRIVCRLFVLSLVLSWLIVPLSMAATAHAGDSKNSFSAAAVVLKTTGDPGPYSLPEPPAYPLAACIGNGSTVEMHAPGSITVMASGYFTPQKVSVEEYIWQRLANGSYSLVAQGNGVSVDANPTYPVTASVYTVFDSLPVGPDYVFAYHITWYALNNIGILGTADVAYSLYHREYNGATLADASVCGKLRSPLVAANPMTGTVNTTCSFTLEFYPRSVSVPITWDGNVIGSVLTSSTDSFSDGSFKIPASPMGPHSVHWKYGHWDSTITYTVKPRIKVIPSSNVQRGSTVNVSLRGYAAHETVRIRWKHGSGYTDLTTVTTSTTGSANKDIKVPTWVPNGTTSVRGDGEHGRAQTNAVTVSGGPLTSSAVKTSSPTPTRTPTPIATATSTPTPDATSSPETTVPEATETPTPTETATPEPSPELTAEATATPTPVEETGMPTSVEDPATGEPTSTP